MRYRTAALGFVCLVGNAAAFLATTPKGQLWRVESPMKVSHAVATELSALPSFGGQDNNKMLSFIEKQVTSTLIGALIAASSLGLALPPPEPAFAAVATPTVVAQKKRLPKEVIAVESAKSQVAAATQAILDAKAGFTNAQIADRAAAKELYNAEKNLEGSKKNAEVATARLKSIKTNSKGKDIKGISSAQSQVDVTSKREKEAQSRYDVAKKVSSQAKETLANKQKAIQKATLDKDAAQKKMKAANEKLILYTQKTAEADKKAQKAAEEKMKAANEKAKADAKKQQEKETAERIKAAEKAKKDEAKLKEKEDAAKQKAAEKAKKDDERAKQTGEKARKTTATQQGTNTPTASQNLKRTAPKTTMTKVELSQAIQAKEIEVKRLARKKIFLAGSKDASREEMNKVGKQLETATQELEKLKALKK